MRVSKRSAMLALSLVVGLSGFNPALAQFAAGKTVVAVPVGSTTVIDTVYTPMRSDVATRIKVGPAVVAPVDTIKLQLSNRVNGGMVSGKITPEEADEITAMLDQLSVTEAQFKLSDGVFTAAEATNLMRKYHMVSSRLDDVVANTNNYDQFMPSFDYRRAGLQRRIQHHVAGGNLTPAEGEQLLAAVNAVSYGYNNMQATGGTLTADELEQSHKDLAIVHAKMRDRISGYIVKVLPATDVPRTELLARIQQGLATKVLSQTEAADLLTQYNHLVVLENSIATNSGLDSEDMRKLARQMENINFILTREITDRQVAGHSSNY